MTTFRLKFKFENGEADNGRLDLYDGAIALTGISRALAITTHAFTKGEIRTHGDAAYGAKLYLLPSKKGSFVIEAAIWVAGTIGAGIFYDFVKQSFLEAVGSSADDSHLSAALQKRIEPTLGELPATLESPLAQLHRPIKQDKDMTLSVTRPRGELLVRFDADTATYLEPAVVPLSDVVHGNVTRYNTLSRWGKFFDRTQQRVVSFHLGPGVSEAERSLVTWSLHRSNLNEDGVLAFGGTAVVAPSGGVKRYNIATISLP